MPELFATKIGTPLAERLRAGSLSDVVGQEEILGDNGVITNMLESGNVKSMVLWGPPGCGKTTIAKLVAKYADAEFVSASAVFTGVAELKKIFAEAADRRLAGRRTILFVDEIHRFNKAQQDSFLPYVEDGTITLIGATTENPSFELNSALLSRAQVVVLKRLSPEALKRLLVRATTEMGKPLPLDADATDALVNMADGDGRYLLNLIEYVYDFSKGKTLDKAGLAKLAQTRFPNYDKGGDAHYNLISALHKAVRGSDPDAALYWVSRMIAGGEDMKYLLRRLTRMSVEDIGLAEPAALTRAIASWQAYERMGSPEGDLVVAQLVIYMATAPKSNASYAAFGKALADAKSTGSLAPPAHILNAPTKMMKDLGYGKGYEYDPDTKDGFSGQNYFPDGLARREYYKPNGKGYEAELKKRIDHWTELRKKKAT
ncbi:MAG: replication-associated recombination protein A [Alphaproteobacteria bacterium]|nr:replication-associated recombination protein A [Alphaproteobacteria bacterium]